MLFCCLPLKWELPSGSELNPFDEIICSISGIIFDSRAQKPSGLLNINLHFSAGYFIYFKFHVKVGKI